MEKIFEIIAEKMPLENIILGLLVAYGIIIYFLPSYLFQQLRTKDHITFFLFNLFLGWTGIPMIAILYLMCHSIKETGDFIITHQREKDKTISSPKSIYIEYKQ